MDLRAFVSFVDADALAVVAVVAVVVIVVLVLVLVLVAAVAIAAVANEVTLAVGSRAIVACSGTSVNGPLAIVLI